MNRLFICSSQASMNFYFPSNNFLTSFCFRRFDGKSNNVKHVKWGGMNENLLRLTPNAYGDNVSQPATVCSAAQNVSKICPYPMELGGMGSTRPSPRLISNILMSQVII